MILKYIGISPKNNMFGDWVQDQEKVLISNDHIGIGKQLISLLEWTEVIMENKVKEKIIKSKEKIIPEWTEIAIENKVKEKIIKNKEKVSKYKAKKSYYKNKETATNRSENNDIVVEV